jgi:hypothetical protein
VLAAIAARQPRARAAARAALRAGQKISITTSTPATGLVIPANQQHVVIRIDGAVLVPYFEPAITRIGLSLCYCSVTGTCWVQSLRARDAMPKSVGSCSGRG